MMCRSVVPIAVCLLLGQELDAQMKFISLAKGCSVLSICAGLMDAANHEFGLGRKMMTTLVIAYL